MKKLPLPHGLFTLIDDEDFERCGQFRWHLSHGYVSRKFYKSDGSRTSQLLSRFIMNPDESMCVDHINGNLLDNRKSELRVGTTKQNCCNRGKNKNNTSGFKGVSWYKQLSKWAANIKVDRKPIHLGYFVDINDAIAAYTDAANKYHGEFARTSW